LQPFLRIRFIALEGFVFFVKLHVNEILPRTKTFWSEVSQIDECFRGRLEISDKDPDFVILCRLGRLLARG
jgi:hypothetical protein